jgi:hypothetical protein
LNHTTLDFLPRYQCRCWITKAGNRYLVDGIS